MILQGALKTVLHVNLMSASAIVRLKMGAIFNKNLSVEMIFFKFPNFKKEKKKKII